jgi:hypothetical protein
MRNKWIADEDVEDFEQEQKIREWLNKNGETKPDHSGFDFKYISSKGTARNSRVRASLSLDQKIQEDSRGTFADIIAGSDGRDLYRGEEPSADQILDAHLACMGFDEELSEWIIKTLKLSVNQKKTPYEKFLISLLSEIP